MCVLWVLKCNFHLWTQTFSRRHLISGRSGWYVDGNVYGLLADGLHCFHLNRWDRGRQLWQIIVFSEKGSCYGTNLLHMAAQGKQGISSQGQLVISFQKNVSEDTQMQQSRSTAFPRPQNRDLRNKELTKKSTYETTDTQRITAIEEPSWNCQ